MAITVSFYLRWTVSLGVYFCALPSNNDDIKLVSSKQANVFYSKFYKFSDELECLGESESKGVKASVSRLFIGLKTAHKSAC